jgi:hypothetical protein
MLIGDINLSFYTVISNIFCSELSLTTSVEAGGPGSIPGTTQKEKKKVVGLERGPLSLVSTTEELLVRKVAAPV